MKKCPKCGTILDDAKKKCYMCGSDIQQKTRIDFMNGFDDQIGAAVTKSQDNVFNSVPDISVKLNEVIEKSNNNATFTSGSSPADFYKNEMNSFNSGRYDERTAIEKIFSNDSRFRNNDEINADMAMKNNSKSADNLFFSADDFVKNQKGKKNDGPSVPVEQPINNMNNDVRNVMMVPPQPVAPPVEQPVVQDVQPVVVQQPQTPVVQQVQAQAPVIQQVQAQAPVIQQVQPAPAIQKTKKEKKVTEKPAINWGNNSLKKANKKDFNFINNKDSNSSNINWNFIFNTVCFVLFASALIFMYFKFRENPEKDGAQLLGGLYYKVDDKFKLKDDDSFSKYYTHGENCGVKIKYGKVKDQYTYVDDYLAKVKEDYPTDKGFITQLNEIKIKDNMWSEITVAELKDNPAAAGGYSVSAKYRFVTMVYKGNFYEIRYVNIDEDNKCSAMYDDLIDSLEFK